MNQVARSYAADFVVLRKLLMDGEEAIGRTDDVSVRVGLLQADLAGEMLVKLALRSFGTAIDPKSELRKLLEQVDKAAGRTVICADALLMLRRMRNAVMHDGVAQDPNAARSAVARARDSLVKAAVEVFQTDLLNLRLTDFVATDEIKQPLAEAAALLDADKYIECVGYAVAAFDRLMSLWAAYNQRLFDLREPPTDKFARIVGTLSAGIFLPSLLRFRTISEGINGHMTVSGKVFVSSWRTWADRPTSHQRDDARYALDFVAGVTLQIEGKLGGAIPSGALA